MLVDGSVASLFVERTITALLVERTITSLFVERTFTRTTVMTAASNQDITIGLVSSGRRMLSVTSGPMRRSRNSFIRVALLARIVVSPIVALGVHRDGWSHRGIMVDKIHRIRRRGRWSLGGMVSTSTFVRRAFLWSLLAQVLVVVSTVSRQLQMSKLGFQVGIRIFVIIPVSGWSSGMRSTSPSSATRARIFSARSSRWMCCWIFFIVVLFGVAMVPSVVFRRVVSIVVVPGG